MLLFIFVLDLKNLFPHAYEKEPGVLSLSYMLSSLLENPKNSQPQVVQEIEKLMLKVQNNTNDIFTHMIHVL